MSETPHPLRSGLRNLYFGHTQEALAFQAVLLVLDVLIVGGRHAEEDRALRGMRPRPPRGTALGQRLRGGARGARG